MNKVIVNSVGNLQGTGPTENMEVREWNKGSWAIMHSSNGAIIYYGNGTKEEAVRILYLWTAAEEMAVVIKQAYQFQGRII
jgi:hypothetical protein